VFVYADGPTAAFPRPRPFLDRDIPAFQPVSAASLVLNRWLSPDEPPGVENSQLSAEVDKAGKTLEVSGQRPIRYVGFLVRGDVVHYVAPRALLPSGAKSPNQRDTDQVRLRLPIAELNDKFDTSAMVVRVQDDAGNLRDIPVTIPR
jgi:hypothetical protein